MHPVRRAAAEQELKDKHRRAPVAGREHAALRRKKADCGRPLLGLPATGAVGPLTWEGMARLAADVEASSRSAEGQYPGYVLSEEA